MPNRLDTRIRFAAEPVVGKRVDHLEPVHKPAPQHSVEPLAVPERGAQPVVAAHKPALKQPSIHATTSSESALLSESEPNKRVPIQSSVEYSQAALPDTQAAASSASAVAVRGQPPAAPWVPALQSAVVEYTSVVVA